MWLNVVGNTIFNGIICDYANSTVPSSSPPIKSDSQSLFQNVVFGIDDERFVNADRNKTAQ